MRLLKRILLALIAGLALVISLPLITAASPLAYQTVRLFGQDRVETALSIAQKGWSSAQTVILCEYSDYADSIAATPYAVSLNAPLLLTEGNAIDQRVVNELQRLKPQKVILLGGSGCLKTSIEKELENLSLKWERIGGADRYETSILLARKINSDSLILANGDDFPDALSAAAYAGIQQIPIVLTSRILPSSVCRYYQDTQPQHLLVIGGESVVPSQELTKNKLTVETRLGGRDRYETNAKVISYMKDSCKSNDLFLASGITFPDAVAGTVLASRMNAPLLLTEKEDIPSAVYCLLREHMVIEPPPVSPSNSASSASSAQQGIITAAGGLNLRETPSASGRILLTIPEGTTVDLSSQQDQWYKTTYQGQAGWISANYITVITINKPKQGKITAAGGLNLRETPSLSGNILTMIPADAFIYLAEEQDNWYKTTYQGQTGWVYADYVSIVSSDKIISATTVDLSLNGTLYILGGPGIISLNAQNIIEGKASSSYADNLKDFPALPTGSKTTESPSRGSNSTETPVSDTDSTVDIADPAHDPAEEVLLDPFQGIPAQALAGKTIVVDPGHGGKDPGAIGPANTYEKRNNLAIALALNEILKQAGAEVILTRSTDASPAAVYSEANDLQARVALTNKYEADLFISIHNDAALNPLTQGTTEYVSDSNPKPAESLQLANKIQSELPSALQTNDMGVRKANFYVIKNANMPAVLVEAAYISNPYEEARLQNPVFRKNVAAAIYHGIYKYFQSL
ncbi:MAG TPA: N-acetylmuramoyl-L-alanine amidase [Desulfitobacteriaceae bacterium]|nr:N-acetylmuramoyl-L-alanine amidase [Desulfitobacteriaceae bacterium]